jgi:hypothetical protein
MLSPETQDMVRRAEHLYEGLWRAQLEDTHRNWFIAIEPDSGDYYLGRSMHDAIEASRQAHPNRLCHVLRIGHPAAFEVGNLLE